MARDAFIKFILWLYIRRLILGVGGKQVTLIYIEIAKVPIF